MNTFLRYCALASLSLTGCSSLFGPEGYFRDRGDDYLKSDVLPEIRLPQGVEQRNVDQLYVIPPINEETELAQEFEVPRPLTLADSAFTDRVKIQKLGDKRWILISAPPAEVWPQVRGFLSRNNLEVVYTDASTGIIETGWLKFVNDEETQSRYRLRIEQGIQPETTEIHVLHLSAANAVAQQGSSVPWPDSSTSAERESWMVDELAGVIASNTSGSQAASLMAQSIGFTSKVTLDTEPDEPVLRLKLDRVRALATLGHSLEQGGYYLWGQDADRGFYYVTYDEDFAEEADEEPGFLGRLFGAGDNKAPVKPPYNLEDLLAHLQPEDTALNRRLFAEFFNGDNQMLHQAPGFLVVAYSQGQDVEVRIRNAYGQKLVKQEAKHLLTVIRQNLI